MGIFRVEINPDLQLSQEERLKLEQTVQNEIEDYIKDRNGQPAAIFSDYQECPLLDGISNLDELSITTSKAATGRDDPGRSL
ncbi:MAG UNVERIFIED_CONTAM: hypothetical protein LVR29_06205 [Microcystis novacekii LVE1205-3]|jgi:hypothetical protein